MVFSSNIFLFCFLPLTIAVYFLLGRRFQNLWLLAVSLVFYAWGEVTFVAVMVLSILTNYGAGLLVDRYRHSRISRCVLVVAIVINLGLLGVFKYLGFLSENLNWLLAPWLDHPIPVRHLHLPIGISFFTFQALSYVIEVYQDVVPVQRNPINIGLYISLFPQLIAGPIVRYHDVARQIVQRTVNLTDFAEGIERFVYGLGKKVLIANGSGALADTVFAIPGTELTTPLAWAGIFAYTLQIYFDFSGYSDMAIGLGKMFGFHFPENFNYPYISSSLREFWRRWHISLSTWFRDYLYIPLGGSRRGTARTYFNLVTVFFLVGLWHGASWNFVFWGLFHGFFLVLERIGGNRWLNAAWAPLRHLYAMAVVVVGWVFFRADTFTQAWQYLRVMSGLSHGNPMLHPLGMYLNLERCLILTVGAVLCAPLLPWLKGLGDRLVGTSDSGKALTLTCCFASGRNVTLALILLASILSLASGSYNPFIYFRF